MARSLLFLSSRFILILLLCYSLSPISIWQNQIPSGESLFLSLKLDSRVFPSRNNGPRKANGAVLPPCLKAKASLFVLEVGLSTLFLLMLAGDVSTNPGPQTVRPGSQGIGENSSFVSLTSDEESASMDDTVEFHNDSDDSSQNDLSPDGFDYFNLHLGHKGIRFGSWNVNRLTTTKLEQIKLFLLNEDGRPRLDILSINETFLKPLLPDCLYSVPGFTVHRKDRMGLKNGGGVLIYVNDDLKHRRRVDIEHNNNIEALWLEVFPFKSNRPILFAGIYRPPSTNLSEDEAIENMLELVYLLNLETIITGDININFISPAYKKHPLGRAFSNMNFKQLITEVTRPSSGTCLDFVLSNFPERIKSIVVKNNGLSDHLPVFGVRLYEDNAKRQNKSLTIKYRNTKHFDKSAFVSDLKEVPWNTAFVFDDLTDILNAWMGLFNNILDAHCPWRVKKVAKQNQAPWMTVNILQALRRRDSLLRKARQSRCVTDWNCFKIARNKVVNMIRSAKYKYYNTCFNNNKGNSKKMWKTIKSLMGDVSKSVETPNVVLAEKFNDHFTSIADSLRNLLPNVPYCNSKVENFVCSRKDPDVLFNIPPVTKDFVLGALLGLKTNKAMGIDKISARYLKIAGPAIAYSITQILNISINSGVFPDCWKIAKVIPLFKSGDREDPDNYRPISILPVLSKILERHIHDHLYNYLCENNLLYPLQSGFRKHHGTDTALIRVIDNLLFNLDNDQVSGLLLVDYRKAFDMVDREILLQKLNAYGLTPVASKWFSSYLTDRHQFIAIDNVTSDSTLVRHGVPQGSILGPLLFVIYINDLPLHVNGADLDLYADDTTLTLSADISAVDSLQDSLAASLKEIECWTHTNKLPLNEKKTKTLLVTGKRLGKKLPDGYNLSLKTMNGVSLEQVPSAKLLGIDIDHDLSMNTYVDRLCKKISQRIGILNKIKLCLPFNQRLLFYNSLIKPLFDYANVAWQSLCSNESLLRILRLQKRAARVLLDAEPRSSSVMLFNRLKWIPFYDSTKMAKCSILFKRINYCVPNYLNDSLRLLSSVHSRNTRFCKYNFLLPKFKRAREGGKTFLVSAIKLWNQLKPELKKSNTLKAFKDNVFKYYYKDQSCLAHFNP